MENEEILDDSSVADEQLSDTRGIVEKAMDEHEATNEPEHTEPEHTEPEPPKHDPWKSWKKDAQVELNKLPENVQKHIIDREDQFHKGLEQYKQSANAYKSIDKAISPYKEYLSQLGVSPEIAFPNLLKTERTLRVGNPQEKVEMFQKLAYDYGIDLRALAEVPYDANYAQLKSQKEWLESQLQTSNDFRQSHEDSQMNSVIEDFGAQHPYFDDVRLTMADLLEKGLATNLDDAYAKAIRLDEKVQAQRQSDNKTAQLSKANQAAQAARQSAVQVKGSPIGVKNQSAPKTTEDAVRMAMLAHGF